MLLDLVLDPLAVDEKRWNWELPGIYYGIPILNFFGWLFVPLLILLIFQYAPGILFIFLPIIASRPCFERGLVIPGYVGVIISLTYLLIAISRF